MQGKGHPEVGNNVM